MPAFPMDPEELAAEIEIPLDDWPGNCHGIAEAVLRRVPVEGMRLVRGHYDGHVRRDSVYRGGLQQHSWLELADGRVLDPTRWAMSQPDRPFIYLGENDAYDEGGLMIRAAGRPGIQAAAFLSGADLSGPHRVVLDKLAAASPADIEELFRSGGLPVPEGDLAERDAERLHDRLSDPVEHFREPETFFGLIRDLGLAALVPVDTMIRATEPERVTVARGANHLFEVEPAPELTDQQRLFKIFCRFLSIEQREMQIEDELEELGYRLEELHDALNEMERCLKHDPEGTWLPRAHRDLLAVVAGDILGKGFGTELEVERYARSIGLPRDCLHEALEAFGDRAGYDLGWLAPDELAKSAVDGALQPEM